MHPAISKQQIDNLFHSDNWLDRMSVACNSSLSEECLRQLAQDKNGVVKQATQELLSKRKN